jgi:hypothetical protein
MSCPGDRRRAARNRFLRGSRRPADRPRSCKVRCRDIRRGSPAGAASQNAAPACREHPRAVVPSVWRRQRRLRLLDVGNQRRTAPVIGLAVQRGVDRPRGPLQQAHAKPRFSWCPISPSEPRLDRCESKRSCRSGETAMIAHRTSNDFLRPPCSRSTSFRKVGAVKQRFGFRCSPGLRIDQIRFLQNLDIGRDSRLRHPKRVADLVDVEWSALAQQPQDTHTNWRSEPADDFKLRD